MELLEYKLHFLELFRQPAEKDYFRIAILKYIRASQAYVLGYLSNMIFVAFNLQILQFAEIDWFITLFQTTSRYAQTEIVDGIVIVGQLPNIKMEQSTSFPSYFQVISWKN